MAKDLDRLSLSLQEIHLERDRYRAALEKMVIEGAGKPCVCGCCYVCIAKDALARYPKSEKAT